MLTASFTPRRTPAQVAAKQVDGLLVDRRFGGNHRPLGAKGLTRFHKNVKKSRTRGALLG